MFLIDEDLNYPPVTKDPDINTLSANSSGLRDSSSPYFSTLVAYGPMAPLFSLNTPERVRLGKYLENPYLGFLGAKEIAGSTDGLDVRVGWLKSRILKIDFQANQKHTSASYFATTVKSSSIYGYFYRNFTVEGVEYKLTILASYVGTSVAPEKIEDPTVSKTFQTILFHRSEANSSGHSDGRLTWSTTNSNSASSGQTLLHSFLPFYKQLDSLSYFFTFGKTVTLSSFTDAIIDSIKIVNDFPPNYFNTPLMGQPELAVTLPSEVYQPIPEPYLSSDFYASPDSFFKSGTYNYKYYIKGVVSETINGVKQPLAYSKVALLLQDEMRVVDVVSTDAQGVYLFKWVASTPRYIVIAIDNSGRWGLEGIQQVKPKEVQFDGYNVQYPNYD